ncbi:MAG TPA: TIGR02466 family protein [Micropepsaceae bacterium]|jgi:uncharacterized protein (TIGR02466 family)
MFALNHELSLVFATPLSLRTVPNAATLNAGLERAILSRRQTYGGNRISNIGGWQSLPDLLDWPEPEVKQLAAEIDRTVQQMWTLPAALERRPRESQTRAVYRAYGWANVNEPGHYNMIHMHPGNHFSAVYYVATGKPAPDHEMNGRLELRDPRPAATYCRMPGSTSESLLIRPQPGMMVVFPAWIEHWVHPFQGDGQRISIAVNITFDGH